MHAHLLNVTGRRDAALQTLAAYEVVPIPAGRVSRPRLDEWIMRSEISLAAGNSGSAGHLAAEARQAVATSLHRPWLALWEARAALAEGKAKLLSRDARDARPLLEQAVALQKQMLDSASPALADAELALSSCYIALRETEKAAALLKASKAIYQKHSALSQHHLKSLAALENRIRSL